MKLLTDIITLRMMKLTGHILRPEDSVYAKKQHRQTQKKSSRKKSSKNTLAGQNKILSCSGSATLKDNLHK